MKKEIIKRLAATAAAAVLMLTAACSDNELNDVMTYGADPVTPPEITSVNPSEVALSGVTEIEIKGSGFSSNPEDNIVYVKATQAEVLEASPDRIVIKAPVFEIPWDSTSIDGTMAVTRQYSAEYADFYSYRIKAPVKSLQNIGAPTESFRPEAITVGPDGLVYASVLKEGDNNGVYTVSEEGYTFYAQGFPSGPYKKILYGPGGDIYGLFTPSPTASAVFTLNPGGPHQRYDAGGLRGAESFDFDANENLWFGTTTGQIFMMDGQKNVKSFEYEPNVYSVRVFDGYLYVGAKTPTNLRVDRFEILADSIGQAETYYDLADRYSETVLSDNTVRINAIEFAADGDMYLGTNIVSRNEGPDSPNEPILVVHPDGSAEEFYDGLLAPVEVIDMAWGTGEQMYYTRGQYTADGEIVTQQAIMKIEMQKQGAPHYGRD